MGDTNLTNLWRRAFVLVAFDLDATIPADIDTAFNSDWDDVGILVKGGPSGTTAYGQDTDFYGRNGEFLDSLIDDRSDVLDFACHEDNEVTQALRGVESGIAYAVGPVKVRIALETRNLDKKRRKISAAHALIFPNGATTAAENEVESFSFQARVIPDGETVNADGAPAVWIEQRTNDASS